MIAVISRRLLRSDEADNGGGLRMIELNYIPLKKATIAFDKCINKAATVQIARALYEAKEAVLSEVETMYDVQPVKRRKWITTEELYYNGMVKCSYCNEEYYTEDIQNLQGDLRVVNYCPNCGARMDGEQNA